MKLGGKTISPLSYHNWRVRREGRDYGRWAWGWTWLARSISEANRNARGGVLVGRENTPKELDSLNPRTGLQYANWTGLHER